MAEVPRLEFYHETTDDCGDAVRDRIYANAKTWASGLGIDLKEVGSAIIRLPKPGWWIYVFVAQPKS